MANENRERVWDAIREFIHEFERLPGWKEWRRGKMDHVLSYDDPWWLKEGKVEIATEFVFPDEIEKKHAVVMGFLRLSDSVGALKECEFYFRRYPFKNLPVQRYRHLVNVCEMYFNRFYEIRERIKAVLNAVKRRDRTAKARRGEVHQDVRQRVRSGDTGAARGASPREI